jgi:hypothetical protein
MDTSAIVIEELSGFGRQLVFSGAGLPFKPAEWQSKLSVKTTWYTGNDRASQQVLGPQDPPAKWNGKWSYVQLIRCPVRYVDETGQRSLLTQPMDVVAALETIQRQGAALRCTWVGSNGNPVSVVREGRLETFTYKIHTPYDIDWEWNFEWTGRNGASAGQGVTSTRADNTADAGSMQTAFTSYLSGIYGIQNLGIGPLPYVGPPAPFNPGSVAGLGLGLSNAYSTIGAYENFSQTLLQGLVDFTNEVTLNQQNLNTLQEVYVTEGNQTFATSNTFADFAADTAQQTADQIQSMGQVPLELFSNSNVVSDISNAAAAFGQAWGLMVALQGNAKDLELSARQNQSTNPGGAIATTTNNTGSPLKGRGLLATHTVRRNETVINISMQYYGSPDFCVLILRANHLPWWTVDLPVGKILIIPVQPSQQGGVNA